RQGFGLGWGRALHLPEAARAGTLRAALEGRARGQRGADRERAHAVPRGLTRLGTRAALPGRLRAAPRGAGAAVSDRPTGRGETCILTWRVLAGPRDPDRDRDRHRAPAPGGPETERRARAARDADGARQAREVRAARADRK